ncbi:hypothetical protein [Nioella aestuarii]|uniref:hypothetical protein n=1 Tax=Nioella aestuarii TaxID=1662864 RepID=UPI003D7F94EE
MSIRYLKKAGVYQAFLALGLVLAVSAPTQAQTFELAVDDSFVESDIRFTGELGIVYSFLWRAVAYEGEVAICGVGRVTRPRLRTTVRGMLRGASIQTSGQDVPLDLTYFTNARSVPALRTETATCRSTGIPLSQASGGISLIFGDAIWRN